MTSRPEWPEVVKEVDRPAAFVVVEGEPGAGRTTLLGRLGRHERQDSVVLEARCARLADSVPLGPVLEALKAATVEWAAAASRLSPLAGCLRPLLPELDAVLPPPLEAADSRALVFRALRELLTLHERTVLLVDDVHDADEETRDLLRYLAACPSPRLAVVTGSVPRRRQPVPGATWWPPRTGVTAHFTLEPLEIEQVAELVDSRGLAERIHRRTGGVAGAVDAVLKAIADVADERSATKLAESVLPSAWTASVAARLADTSPGCASLVEAAAVLGYPAGSRALAEVSGVDGDGIVDALMCALDAGFLLDLGRDRYRIRSPLLADSVYDSIPGPRRCLMHTRAAELLAADTEPAAVRIARHHREAGALDEWIRWTSAAVDSAAAEGSPDVAVRLLAAVLGDPGLSRAGREKFAVRLSREMVHGLVDEDTVRLLRGAVRDWSLSRTARGEIRLNLGRVLINQAGQVDAGRSEIELALTDLSGKRALLARGLATLALPHVGAVSVEENLRWLDQAEQVSKGIRDVEVLAAVTANRMSSRMQVADPGVWQDVGDPPDSPPSADVRRQVSRTYINLADAAAWNGHYPVARTYLATARRLIHDEHQPYLEALADGARLRIDVATGAWTQVETEARHLAERVGHQSSLAAEPLLALGWHDFGLGHRASALSNFDAAFALAGGSVPLQASAFAGRVAVLLAAKDLAAARRLTEFGLDSLRRKNNWVWAAELMPLAVRVMLDRQEAGAAGELVAEYRQGIAGRDAPLAHAAEILCRGLLARARPAEAAELFGQAAKAYHSLPRPYAAAGADELAGECHLELDDQERLLGAFTSAETTYRALGALVDAQRCRRILVRREDPRTPRRGRRGYGQALSPREREVVLLAARNLTNRQIAERLFLSARTVEVHIGRALSKLDLPSRAVLSEELLRTRLSLPHDSTTA
ncbi:ATP-binding protein [Amycolatopsis sp. NPDC102389]|uniref:ATP-binding protein n=1 Tax=Amycolatopsis sp. NPDC102389 TaxID=3363941 RepID=UPI0038219BC7